MSPAPKTQDDYITGLAPASRSVAQRIRALVHQAAPEAIEAIKYGMPAFLIEGSPFVYFAVWTKHVGIYPIYGAPPDLEAKIAPYRHAKDTVRFFLAEPIDYELIALLVRFKRDQALGRATRTGQPRRKATNDSTKQRDAKS
jgi:uncharacterized protein YdhG (YjbR/CyaY superfamily)